MEWTPTSGEQERHNVTVITVGSKYEVYVRSPAPSHMQTLNNPFEPCNKVRGEYFSKEVFLHLNFYCVRPLFLRLLSLRRYVSSIYMYATEILYYTIFSQLFPGSKNRDYRRYSFIHSNNVQERSPIWIIDGIDYTKSAEDVEYTDCISVQHKYRL